MQNLGKDLDHVVGVLLKGSATERKDVMQRCFTEDAEFTHHLLQLHGREEIFALYQYWHDINLKLDFYNTNKIISENGDQVFLQLHEPITTYLLPFLTVEMFLQVILEIKKTEHGLVISRQEDHILWAETFVHQLPIFGSFYINYVRRWVGLAIVYLMYAVKFVTTSFDYCFAQTSTQIGQKYNRTHSIKLKH